MNLRAATLFFSLFVAPMLAFGSFWYIRTWVHYGNPVYPVKVELLGVVVFPGIRVEDFLSVPYVAGSWWKEVFWQWYHDLLWSPPRYYPFDARPGGFGPLWSYLAAPVFPVFVFEMIRRKPWAIVNFLLPVAVVFLIQPSNWWSRFTMTLLAAGMIGLVYCIDRAPTRTSAVGKAVVAVLVMVGLWFCSAKINQTITATRILRLATLPREERTIGRVAYPSFEWIDSVDRHARIGVDATTPELTSAPIILFFYPLFGSHFDHRVYPLVGTSESAFRNYLTTSGVDYIMVGGRGRFAEFAEEAARAGCLQEISASENPSTRAYRVSARCATAPKR